MRTFALILSLLFFALLSYSQNVGIGTPTPAEKLDVNGNINLNGQLKINTNGGQAGQVLMKDQGNNLVWGDYSEYKNMAVFDCNGLAATPGSNNCNYSWQVPAGVTIILVECWGGGGGGSNLTGGGGGGYVSARLNLAALSTTSLTVGAGGYFSVSSDGIVGGNTSFNLGGITLTGHGGMGGESGDPFTTNVTVAQAQGGSFSASVPPRYFGLNGSPGGISKLRYVQVSATEFGKAVDFGDGGDTPLFPGSGGKGGFRITSTSQTYQVYASQYAVQPGGGGGADNSGGFYGRGGRIIIRW